MPWRLFGAEGLLHAAELVMMLLLISEAHFSP